MGLLLPHKSTLMQVFPDMVSLSTIKKSHSGGGKRNDIEGFSPDSRYRLFRLIHSLSFSRISFVTLTYPKTFPTDGKREKADLKRFRRATERRFGPLRAIWRLEYQKRGAPHFHLLYLDPPFIPVQVWNTIWDDACKTPFGQRKGNSLDLKISNEAKGSDVVGKYLGKYVAKPVSKCDTDVYIGKGRVWGRWNIEIPEPERIELYDYEAKKIRDLLLPDADTGGWRPLQMDSFTVFGDQMGSPEFGSLVLRQLEHLFERTRYNPKVRAK